MRPTRQTAAHRTASRRASPFVVLSAFPRSEIPLPVSKGHPYVRNSPQGTQRSRPQPLASPRIHRDRPADGRPRRDHREHRPALRPDRTWASRTATASGSSPPTPSPSAVCCCSAAGSPTSGAASAPSSSVWSASRAASALGGAATNEAMLLGARALQGVFGALLAPAALSLLAVTFTDAKERAKAFGIYGAIAGGGGAVGLILGGVLTEYLNWRWTFFVNIPFAVDRRSRRVLRHPRAGRRPQPLAARHPRRDPVHPRPGRAGLRLHPRRVRRLERLHDPRPVRRLRGPAARLRHHRGQGQGPAAAPARRHRTQPRRRLPLARPRDHRDVRPVPLPHLLPADRQGLLADQDRLRLPADGRRA